MTNREARHDVMSTVAKAINWAASHGMCVCINGYSVNDPEIDFKVIVKKGNKNDAIAAIERASERYSDEEDEKYYYNGWLDTVKEELSSTGITYAAFYKRDDDKGDDDPYETIAVDELVMF